MDNVQGPVVKVHKPLAGTPWRVDCSVCDGFIFPLHPWALTSDQPTASILADWHVRLHAEQQCASCGHFPPIAKLKPLKGDQGLFEVGGKLYQLRGDRVREMVVS